MSRSRRTDGGFALIEAIVALALLALGLMIVLPAAAALGDSARGAAAAREMAMALHAMRWRSVAESRSYGLWFRADVQGWSWYEVRDGNGNGLRTAELLGGTDEILSGPQRLQQRVPGMRFGFPPGPLPKIPPQRGNLQNLADPVKFGRSDIVAFGPLGTSSSGTLYLTDGRRVLFGVLLYGRSTRVRVWRYRAEEGQWTL